MTSQKAEIPPASDRPVPCAGQHEEGEYRLVVPLKAVFVGHCLQRVLRLLDGRIRGIPLGLGHTGNFRITVEVFNIRVCDFRLEPRQIDHQMKEPFHQPQRCVDSRMFQRLACAWVLQCQELCLDPAWQCRAWPRDVSRHAIGLGCRDFAPRNRA